MRLPAGKGFNPNLFYHQGHQVHQEKLRQRLGLSLSQKSLLFGVLGELGALGG